MGELAPLLDRHVVVDLETTGLDPSVDEVIELGALFIERGEVVRRVSRLFGASQPLSLAIRRITGITDADLHQAPPFSSFLPELKRELRGWTVVAHNAAFEQSFLADVLQDIRAPVLDSCELLHYLYPELESHSLDSLIRWAKVGPKAAHRALQDCEDTFGVLRFALSRCVAEGRTEDVRELLSVLAPLGENGELFGEAAAPNPLVRLLRQLEPLCAAHRPLLTLSPHQRFLPAPEERRRQVKAPRVEPEQALAPKELTHTLGPGGRLESQVSGFSSRTAQLSMAQQVGEVLTKGGMVAVEAGTGTGKSLAYLTPAVLFASRSGKKVAVAPHTKALQDQLVQKDLPRLHQALGRSFGYAVLKGQGNYLCRRRALELTTPAGENWTPEERAPRAYLRAFLQRSPDGDLDRLSFWFRERYPLLEELVRGARSEAATTLGERCPHYHRCYYHSAVAQAKEADLLVINQALSLVWPERYPEVDHLILDEAHELEDVATTAFSEELDALVLMNLRERWVGRRGVLGELRRQMHRQDAADWAERLKSVQQAAHELWRIQEQLAETINQLCRKEVPSSGAHAVECRLTAQLRTRPEWKRVREALVELQRSLERITQPFGTQAVPVLPMSVQGVPGLERELTGALTETRNLSGLVAELIDEPSEARCYQASSRSRGPELYFQLCAQPIEVSGLLKTRWEQVRSLVLTSATLSTGGARSWVLDRLGLGKGEAHYLQLGTPFELSQQALVVLVTDAPDPGGPAFVDWASARVAGLAQFLGGRVLGLFASNQRLEAVAQKVRHTLEPAGIEVLQQYRGSSQQLASRQEADGRSVLLGTRSFWQGVDIRGRGVECVFIDKLPIEPHNRPIVAAREERWSSEGNGYLGFVRYRLPRALLMLRQGVGRLIRSTEDRGVVVIADPGHPRYRSEVLNALKGYRVEALPWAQARVRLHQEMSGWGLGVEAETIRTRPGSLQRGTDLHLQRL